jgi:pimeloyl-ACP methyl ester carboxylesterase
VKSGTSEPDTIVLIHGFWVTPRSWEHWKARYESQGYRVLAPAYPGYEVEVEALNADPTPIEKVTIPMIIAHLEAVIKELPSPPILIGHSAGGAFTQILLDHDYGAAGVAINSAPTEGVKIVPLSQVRSTFPVLNNPANRHKAVGLTHDQWHYAFTNTFPQGESRALYERYHVPASGEILWGSVLANFQPGHQDTWVDYHNDKRAPLLFISGGEDHLMPPSIQRSNAKHYKSNTITELTEYEGKAHLLPAQDGWEEIADFALAWALDKAARQTAPSA